MSPLLGLDDRQAHALLRQFKRRHSLTHGDLAAVLGVSVAVLDAWMEGRRGFTQAQRRLVWLVSSLLDGTAPRNLFELSTWNRFRDWEAEEREREAGTVQLDATRDK